jgi:peptidoglycan/LPS O-acetylase OafA/YrhL
MDEGWDAHAAAAAPVTTRVPGPAGPTGPPGPAREAPAEAELRGLEGRVVDVGRAGRADDRADGQDRPDRERKPFRLGYRPELDGLRGLGLIIVVSHHTVRLMWEDADEWIFPGGQVGLDVFFALSGFLITALLLGEFQRTGRIDVLDFVRRRALRLVPALVVMMAGLLAISFVGTKYSPGLLLSSAGWVVTFSTNLALDRPIVELIHTWSLSVEAHFYLFWCVTVALVVPRVRRPYHVLAGLALGIIVVVGVVRAWIFRDGVDVVDMYVNTLYRLDGPLIGALAGVAVVAGWTDRIPRRWAAWSGAVAMAALAIAAFRTRPISPVLFEGVFTAMALCGAVLVVTLPLAGTTRVRWAVSSRVLVALGTVSYSVYLWHLPLIMWFHRNIPGWPVGGKLFACLGASLVIGTASYYLVERPFLRRKAARG